MRFSLALAVARYMRPPAYISFCLLFISLVILMTGCAPETSHPGPNSDLPALADAVKKPLSPEQSSELLDTVGGNWIYGEGVGDSILTAGTIVAFPPYALWVLGNGILTLGGYQAVNVSDALPEEASDAWKSAYKGVASAPGHVTAAFAGEHFRTQQEAKQRIVDVITAGPREESNGVKSGRNVTLE